MLTAAAAGFGTALLLGIPIGPNGLIALDCTVRHGKRLGIWAYAGSACAMFLHAIAATVLVGWIHEHLPGVSRYLMVSVGSILMVVGITFVVRKVRDVTGEHARENAPPFRWFATTFTVSILNPKNVLVFLAAFSPLLARAGAGGVAPSIGFLCGIVPVFAIWCVVLMLSGDWLRGRLQTAKAGTFQKIRRGVGCVIAGIGLTIILHP